MKGEKKMNANTLTLGSMYERVVGENAPGYLTYRSSQEGWSGRKEVVCGAGKECGVSEGVKVLSFLVSETKAEGPALRVRETTESQTGLFAVPYLERWVDVDGSERLVSTHRSEVVAPEGKEHHDWCFYCGADCGENGEWRQGFDCPLCGGN